MKQVGLEESGARTEADAKRSKSILFEGAQRPSLIDFSGAGADVSPSLHSRDFFGSFLDPAKNEHQRVSTGFSLIRKQSLKKHYIGDLGSCRGFSEDRFLKIVGERILHGDIRQMV